MAGKSDFTSYTKNGGKKALESRGVTGFKSGMPAFEQDLVDQEIWNILAYIKSTWRSRIQMIQAEQTKTEIKFAN